MSPTGVRSLVHGGAFAIPSFAVHSEANWAFACFGCQGANAFSTSVQLCAANSVAEKVSKFRGRPYSSAPCSLSALHPRAEMKCVFRVLCDFAAFRLAEQLVISMVCRCGVDANRDAQVDAQQRVGFQVVDVTDYSNVQAAMRQAKEEFGIPAFLVTCAGAAHPGEIAQWACHGELIRCVGFCMCVYIA